MLYIYHLMSACILCLCKQARPILLRALDDGNYEELLDPGLEKNYNPQEVVRLIACAAASIRHSARRRPKMSQVLVEC